MHPNRSKHELIPLYNRTNGEPCCASKILLKDILRDEWGFEGVVVSDYDGVNELIVSHQMTTDLAAAAADTLAPYLTVTPSLVPAFAALAKHESPPSGAEPLKGDALQKSLDDTRRWKSCRKSPVPLRSLSSLSPSSMAAYWAAAETMMSRGNWPSAVSESARASMSTNPVTPATISAMNVAPSAPR